MLQNLFRRISATTNDPNRVLEVHADDYICNDVVCRHDCLILYRSSENDTQKLDIVMQLDINHTYNKVFSIYRTTDEVQGQLLFHQFRDKLPPLVQSIPDLGTSKVALQNVSQLIRDYPSWTTAHIAAQLAYTDCFKNTLIQSQINTQCDRAMSPLHVAVKSQQMSSVLALVELDARVDLVDENGDTVFHLAATTTKDIIQALTRKPAPNVINSFNNKGCTPFHLACMADRADCVMEFLKAGVDVNLCMAPYTNGHAFTNNGIMDSPSRSMKELLDTYSNRFFNSDIKLGGTPLHWSKTPELTELLIEHGCSVNAKNFQGDTALHVMVKRSQLTCAVMLLSHRADANLQNDEGDTPLHLAVKSGDLSIVQTFIAFGAEVDLLNHNGESARHLAANDKKASGEILFALHIIGAIRCSVPAHTCNDGCAASGQFNGIPPENCAFSKTTETIFEEVLLTSGIDPKMDIRDLFRSDAEESNSIPRGQRVLSLDGGGIRGLVLIQMLDELERILEGPISEFFDLVAGTSTGGILALVLATGKKMSECRCLYFRLKDKVFVGNRPYDSDLLETFLKNELGESKTMGQIEKPKVMVTATLGDRKPADLHIFRNYQSPLELLNYSEKDVLTNEPLPNPRDQLIWQAARATGAAPTYFRPSEKFIDGGLISNNPTLDAITEIHQCNQALCAMGRPDEVCGVKVMVSMGTGRPPLTPVNTIDVFRPDTIWGACRMALGVTNLGQLLVDQATQTDGRVTARAQAICSLAGIPYWRLNPQLTENVALDETNTKILVKMLWETTAYMRSMNAQLQILKTLLQTSSPGEMME